MPYFVFKINNHREYLCVGSFQIYKEARDKVRALRIDYSDPGPVDYRMTFAETEADAILLLKTKKEKTPSEDD